MHVPVMFVLVLLAGVVNGNDAPREPPRGEYYDPPDWIGALFVIGILAFTCCAMAYAIIDALLSVFYYK